LKRDTVVVDRLASATLTSGNREDLSLRDICHNNPFTSRLQKDSGHSLARQLGLNFPKTIVLPDKVAMEEVEGLIPHHFNQVAECWVYLYSKPFDDMDGKVYM